MNNGCSQKKIISHKIEQAHYLFRPFPGYRHSDIFFLRILFPDWKPIEPTAYSKTQSHKEADLLARYGDSYTQNELINTLPLHRAGITGERILVGILDTGFDLEHDCYKNIKKLKAFMSPLLSFPISEYFRTLLKLSIKPIK
jgi:hypothetical protein